MLKPLPQSKGRLIKRKRVIQPAFHETDMMGVIHNSNYFLWFEQGRLQILFEVLTVEEAMKIGLLMPVVENICHYRKPVKFGMPLLLYTTHNIQSAYEGRLVFSHYLIHEKLRTAMAFGQTAMTLVDAATNKLVKEWPAEIWRRYQALK
jgi:acyl-CoA thioester hydrolase